jgi:hypothetical protein
VAELLGRMRICIVWLPDCLVIHVFSFQAGDLRVWLVSSLALILIDFASCPP